VKHLSRVLLAIGIGGLLGATGTLAGQSRDELRRKYGTPISETFIVRPGIVASATYGTGGRIVEWLISPQNAEVIKTRNKTLNRESINAILDELAPLSVRGKPLGGGVLNATCGPANDCAGSEQLYENVTIYFNAAGGPAISYAVVRWKK
jgi:hypothetical protein